MANPHANADGTVNMKTPGYAWPCLVVSLLVAISIVFAWMWLPGVTFPTFNQWAGQNSPGFNGALTANIMGFVPIGALIMALPTSILVRKWGAKISTLIGMALAIIGQFWCCMMLTQDYTIFMIGRFIMGLGLSTTVVSGPTCVSMWFPHTTRGRAMAIWSCWAPVGIFVINAISTPILNACGGNMVGFLWIWLIVMVVCGLLFMFVFRAPRGDEISEVSPERKPFKEIAKFFKSRQLWALIIMFAIFNYMNYSFSQYLKTWLTLSPGAGGLGWDVGFAGIVGGLIVACGALAPIGGFILDKTPRNLKFIWVIVGIASLTLCCALAFNNNTVIFAFYVLFFCIGNMFLNGCCRPMVPTYVFKGGQTAVSLGLAFLTFGQYLGQIPTSYALEPFNHTVAIGKTDPMLAFWALVPAGCVGIIISLFMIPSKKPAGAPAGGPGGGAPAGGGGGGGKPANA